VASDFQIIVSARFSFLVVFDGERLDGFRSTVSGKMRKTRRRKRRWRQTSEVLTGRRPANGPLAFA
jgi:hypothetical protein